ncbi:MAG: D-alanine--D-alanine ligase family protein [Vicinamibacterales bacterium]
MKRLRVGVIYGGRSGEHEVSVASAASILKHLDRDRYEPVAIRIEKDGRWQLSDRSPTAVSASEVLEQARAPSARPVRQDRETLMLARPGPDAILTIEHRGGDTGNDGRGAVVHALGLDVIFPVLHGPYGEDGTVQGLLELANIPYVGPSVIGAAVGMDKGVMKTLFAAQGLPQAKYVVVLKREWETAPAGVLDRVTRTLGFPVFVKPANLGSSVGISKAHDAGTFGPAMELAAQFDRKIVIEAAVPDAREVECAVLGNDDPVASVPGEIVPGHEFYDYSAKYLDTGSTLLIPAPLTDAQRAQVQQLSIAAFKAVEGCGMARVDFLMDKRHGTLFLNEVNTIPGFTTVSMYPKLWEASGLSYAALIDRLIALALQRHAEKQRLRTSVT